MTDKMTVVYAKKTGNVLAAVSHNADPTAELAVEDLARGGMLVRGIPNTTTAGTSSGNEQFEVLPGELEVISVDSDSLLPFQPQLFVIKEKQLKAISGVTIDAVSLTSEKITITITEKVPDVTSTWIQIEGGNLSEPVFEEGEIAKDQLKTDLFIKSLEQGNYRVLALVAGSSPCAVSETV